jgi:hypothetical protein
LIAHAEPGDGPRDQQLRLGTGHQHARTDLEGQLHELPFTGEVGDRNIAGALFEQIVIGGEGLRGDRFRKPDEKGGAIDTENMAEENLGIEPRGRAPRGGEMSFAPPQGVRECLQWAVLLVTDQC